MKILSPKDSSNNKHGLSDFKENEILKHNKKYVIKCMYENKNVDINEWILNLKNKKNVWKKIGNYGKKY